MIDKLLALPQLQIQKSNFSFIPLLLLLYCGSTNTLAKLDSSPTPYSSLSSSSTTNSTLPLTPFSRSQGSTLSLNESSSPTPATAPGADNVPWFQEAESAPPVIKPSAPPRSQEYPQPDPMCQSLRGSFGHLGDGGGTVYSVEGGGAVYYLKEEKRAVLCRIYSNSTTSPPPPDFEIRRVDIMSSSLPGVDIGQLLNQMNIHADYILQLNITGSSIAMVNFSSQTLPRLESLDLRGNSLTVLQPPDIPSLQKLYLSGNDWSCVVPGSGVGKWSISSLEFGKRMSWLLEPRFTKVWQDTDHAKCSFYKSKRWYQEGESSNQEVLVKHFIEFSRDTLSNCPPGCDCELAKPLAEQSSVFYQFRTSVLCSFLNLHELPKLLPHRTVFFDGSNNNVSSLFLLSGLNSPYRYLTKVNMSNNTINSLEGLRDSWLLKNSPTEIDLTNNRISLFDTTILEPMMREHSTKMTSVEEELYFLFAENPWHCDCDRIKHIQEFLAKYQFLLKDAEEMRCSKSPGYIVDISYKTECEQDNQQFMTFLVVAEVVLLVGVLVKLAYDVVNYRRTGHLPWVARHLCGKNLLCLPGISRFNWKRWFQSSDNIETTSTRSWASSQATRQAGRSLGRLGSSGYITASAASSQDASGRLLNNERSLVQFV